MSLLKWLNKPYFFNPNTKSHISLAIGIGFFIFVFLYIFLPFGMSELKGEMFFYCLGFGFVTFFTQTFLFVIVPLIFKDFFKNENWTIGKNILFLFILITAISFFNWVYNSQVQNTENWRLLTFSEIIKYTFLISIFPIFIFTYFSEKFYRLKREKTSKDIMESIVSTKMKPLNKEVTILADNGKDNIKFSIDNLIYITSQGNYSSFFLKTDTGLKETIIRKTLTKIATDFEKYPSIIRCHKSYIINTKLMDSISGNARGYYLESKLLSIQIPVSRRLKKEEVKSLIG